MTVFKLYFKLFFKKIFTILLYLGIFILIILLIMNSSTERVPKFEASKTRVAFYDEDNTELTKGLKQYLEQYADYIEIEDNLLEDAFFYRDIQYIVRVPKGFTDKFLANDPLKIERRLIPDETSGYFIDGKLENYLSLAYTYLNNNLADLNNVSEKIAETASNETNVFFPEGEIKDFRFITIYFNTLGYVIAVLIITITGLVITSFTTFEIRRRNIISKVSNNKFNLSLVSGTIVTSLIFVLLFGFLGFILFKELIFTKVGLLMLLNVLVYTIPIITLSYLISILTKNKMLISGLATVISLGAAFISGAFIPQNLLSQSVLNISKVFPMYFLIENNELLAVTNNFSFSNISSYYINLMIMIGFGILYIVIALIISRRKIKSES
ncbi:MAG: ABC transporter permease [Acholeplasmataceae bacterium]|nr:ABC transporter permease [Acholeplasmataceae bacterium]